MCYSHGSRGGLGSRHFVGENQSRHTREVGNYPNVVHFNICGNLGGQIGKRRERGIFEPN